MWLQSFARSALGVRCVLGPWDNPHAEHSRAGSQYPMGPASLLLGVTTRALKRVPRLRLENSRRRLAILSFRYENVRSHDGNSRVSGFSRDRGAAFAQTGGNAPPPCGRASFLRKNCKKNLDAIAGFSLQACSPRCTHICTRPGMLPGILPKLEGRHYEKTN